ncbi:MULTISPECIES: YihY/virulence factor BrkB family protein [Leptotrichia]|uniref:YihY/virulence factor BrkB family protein n=1 Tax=Leptotrichia TaxID=32067 RepID=UPI0003AE7349|nr:MULTISPECIES: YihY/virulence factor BrkB family protein [Leptotrichia]ERL26884.1 YihY family protein [Leptotrichia sp. oral taxon 225 str. F0581]WLD73957.1 YihY/virulence factor BrkB family protein [Leptotrichia sp. HMT-225]
MKEKKNFQKQKKEVKENGFKRKISEIKRMIYLIYRNYRDGETQILAISLTYYSLLAIFPVVALVLGITKGFGLDKIFIQKFFELWPGNNSFLRVIVDVAQRLLLSTESSILTGVGIVILIYSAVKVLIMLENSFNKIWKINKKRSITRRVIDYIAIIFLGPIFFVLLSALNSVAVEEISKHFSGNAVIMNLFIGLFGPATYIILFSYLFYVIPNTNVKIKPAVYAGIVTTLLTFGWKLLFLLLQSSITRYNIIYGSLALIPIFLIWVQYVWVTILLGAQIAFSIQTSDEFLYSEKIEMPIKVKREAGILILSLIIKNFVEKKESFTYQKLTDRLGMEVFFVKEILSDLEKMGFINEVFYDKNSDSQYQVAYSPESITIREFMKKFDTKNIEYYENIFDNLNEEDKKLLEKIREKLAMKKIENPDPEFENSPEKEETYFSESEQPENFQNTIKPRNPEELTIDFQISKQKNENLQIKDSPKIIRKEKINRESEVQTSQSEDNNSQDTQKRVRYEDGTWKFF